MLNRREWCSLFASTVLTSVLLFCLMWRPESAPPPDKQPERPVMVSSVTIEDKGPEGSTACEKTYDGIGVENNFGGKVIRVAKGHPAWRAGIVPGDVLSDMYETPGWKSFLLHREGRPGVPMRLRTEKICYDRSDER